MGPLQFPSMHTQANDLPLPDSSTLENVTTGQRIASSAMKDLSRWKLWWDGFFLHIAFWRFYAWFCVPPSTIVSVFKSTDEAGAPSRLSSFPERFLRPPLGSIRNGIYEWVAGAKDRRMIKNSPRIAATGDPRDEVQNTLDEGNNLDALFATGLIDSIADFNMASRHNQDVSRLVYSSPADHEPDQLLLLATLGCVYLSFLSGGLLFISLRLFAEDSTTSRRKYLSDLADALGWMEP
ncbi:hypothetical protein FRB93_006262 [Tulasnella sp. JGI-2019a]|nr:hypothetical protein FRB93_006262 [Tulasnella sp. JGI-2019a]